MLPLASLLSQEMLEEAKAGEALKAGDGAGSGMTILLHHQHRQ